MSSTSVANLFKRVRPTAAHVGLNTTATSIPKPRVKYAMRHVKNKNIQVSDASMIDKALRKQLHRRQPPASVTARRDEIRQHDMRRRRTVHFSMDTRLPSFSRAGKLSKFTLVSSRLAIALAREMSIHKIITAELSAASPNPRVALQAAVETQRDLEVFGTVADSFVACLRKVAPIIFQSKRQTWGVDRNWDFFWSVYRYMTTEAEWGRLREQLHCLYEGLEDIKAFAEVKTSVFTEEFGDPMDLSEYYSCGPESVAAQQASLANPESFGPPPSNASSASPQSTAQSHSDTNFMSFGPPPPTNVSPAASESTATSEPATPFHSTTQFTNFGGPPPKKT